MNTLENRKKLEEKLINTFLENFHSKLGYYPVVITNTEKEEIENSITILSLKQLEKCFEPFLPEVNGELVTLNSKLRFRRVTEIRFIFCSIARRMGYGLATIGKQLGNKHHSTVIHGLDMFNTLIKIDTDFKIKHTEIVNHIKQTYESYPLEYLDQVEYQSQPNLLVRLLPEQDQSV